MRFLEWRFLPLSVSSIVVSLNNIAPSPPPGLLRSTWLDLICWENNGEPKRWPRKRLQNQEALTGAIAPKFPLVAVLGFEGCTSVRQVRGTAPALFPADLARLAHAHGAAGHQLQRGGEGAVLGLLDTLGQRGLRVPQLHGHGLLEDDGPGIHLLLQRQQGTGEVALVTKFVC